MKYRIKLTEYTEYVKGYYVELKWKEQLEAVGLKVNEEEITHIYMALNKDGTDKLPQETIRKVDTIIITCLEDLLKIRSIMEEPLIISYDSEYSLPDGLEIYNGYRE